MKYKNLAIDKRQKDNIHMKYFKDINIIISNMFGLRIYLYFLF